jgi:hypothetical protein
MKHILSRLFPSKNIGSLILFAAAAVPLTQMSDDFAHYVEITDENIETGHLVSLANDHYELSRREYDGELVGVVVTNPSVAINTVGHDNTFPIIDSASGSVLVSASNGPLEIGDPITSSDQPGIAMKATRPGIVVGRVLEAYNPSDSSSTKLISATLLFKWADTENSLSPDRPLTQQLLDRIGYGFQLSTIAALEEPSTALRYTLAILVLFLSFFLGFIVFGRVATNGINAIGRNPLARRSIGFAVSINVLVTITITSAGLIVAILILTF